MEQNPGKDFTLWSFPLLEKVAIETKLKGMEISTSDSYVIISNLMCGSEVWGVYLAAAAGVALWAGAAEGLHTVLAHSSVEAGLRVALVHLVLTVFSGEACAACAGKAIDLIHAGTTVKARAVRHTSRAVKTISDHT